MDANVLYPSLLRDILLSLAHADLYIAKWSKDIRNEWTSALINNKPDKKDIILAVADIMDEAIPDCLGLFARLCGANIKSKSHTS